MAIAPPRGPRSLLRQIVDTMAGSAPPQAKLNMVVRTIANSMVAEVCSLYLRRASAEVGLDADAHFIPASSSDYAAYRRFYQNAPASLR